MKIKDKYGDTAIFDLDGFANVYVKTKTKDCDDVVCMTKSDVKRLVKKLKKWVKNADCYGDWI